MFKCSHCGAELKDSDVFCNNCGAEIQTRCPYCKKAVEKGSFYCSHCGKQIYDFMFFLDDEGEPIRSKKLKRIDDFRKALDVICLLSVILNIFLLDNMHLEAKRRERFLIEQEANKKDSLCVINNEGTNMYFSIHRASDFTEAFSDFIYVDNIVEFELPPDDYILTCRSAESDDNFKSTKFNSSEYNQTYIYMSDIEKPYSSSVFTYDANE